jgi:sec-independent protein translocase protein TatA
MTTFAYFTSPQDWLILGLIILVLFGGTKIPQLAKGFGEGIREFKKAVNTEGKGTEEKEEEKSL